ncbi:MAG TPA: hypothetical protein VND65_02345 [Candidatus Binatia bacterium]|nr:hypothetical protein [Candidatus Binatia bacterium]
MLQAHSFLWHYLWLAPHILQVGLAIFIWRRGLHRVFPVFFSYLIFEAAEEFTLYALDLSPSVSGETFWRVFFVGLVVEGLLKIAVIGELFAKLLKPWPAIAKIGGRLITGMGAALVLVATIAAALVSPDNTHVLISGSHILQQTFYIVESGLLIFLFGFVAYFKLNWTQQTFGVALGIGLLCCEHLATWAVMASGAMLDQRHLLDLLNMATYHLCVLIWFYYLLLPQKAATKSAVLPAENNLEIWNRELERLLQQ